MKSNFKITFAPLPYYPVIGIFLSILAFISVFALPHSSFAYTPDDFVLKIDTTNPGNSDANSIVISTRDFLTTYDYTVDWGDGATSTHSGDAAHTYLNPGEYTIAITPNTLDGFPAIFNNDQVTDAKKFIDVIQWGTNQWQFMGSAFHDASFTTITATDAPDLSQVTVLSEMFWFASTLTNITNIENWDVSNVTSMINMFTSTNFNQDLSSWDVSSATILLGMFNKSNLSAENYSAILNGWAQLSVQSGVHFGTNAQYCATAQAARDILTNAPNNWIITDGGATTDCTIEIDEEAESDTSSGSTATRVGDRLKSYFYSSSTSNTTTSTLLTVTKESFIQSVRNFIDYLTKNEEDLQKLTPEESAKIIVGLRDILMFLLTLLPGI